MPADPVPSNERPSPESLLEQAAAEKRGRLKVFLGAAPGVGKTYAMLEAAHRRKRENVDVVIGVVETHGRAETDRLVQGLEALPRRKLEYRGRQMDEFDIDAALARRPQVLLVDELAHSNAPGSRHPKRYQDVEELLAAGIDLYTTLNVQHLESLNDVVAQITRIRVRETLPDKILERADEVELVDLTPEDLIQRLREGKVYVPAQAERAVKHYFQPGNLTALRELALRRTAERVDDQMVDYMRRKAIPGPWPAGERILVCIDDDPGAQRLVRAARRLADMLDARWSAAYVELPRHYRLGDAAKDRIAAALRLAEQLGGEAVTLPGTDLPGEILRYAQGHNITQIIVGKRRRSRWRDLIGRSFVNELLRRSKDVAIHVLTGEVEAEPLPQRRLMMMPQPHLQPYVLSAVAVAIAAVVAKIAENLVELPNLSMIFLCAVLFAAVNWGLWPSIFASLLSAAVFNFFFIPPIYTFTIARPEEVLSLSIFFVVAILTSHLAGRLRAYAEGAQRRVKTTTALFEFSRKLAASPTLDNLLWAISFHVAAAMQSRVVIMLPEDGQLAIKGSYPPEDTLGAAEQMAAQWARDHGEPAGRHSETLPNADMLFLPLKTGQGTVGVLGVQRETSTAPFDPSERRMLDALVDQAAVAIERANLNDEMRVARVLAETEKLRSALLSSISHDLRTPLSSILGSVTSLLSDGARFSEAARRDLLVTIQEEAERLNRFVGNLLDMTRLESGALEVKRDWAELGDLVSTAVGATRARLAGREVRIDLEPGLPLIRVDFVLFEQVLLNLLDNAAKYAPPGSTVKITARREDDNVVIEVIDDGPGVPPPDLERIFDKFYRVRGGERQVAGTGLGLSISRGIVDAHGGQITARSPVAMGHGAAFTIRLPVETQPAGAQHSPAASPVAE
ncbi:MAG TPA: sensor histidine kinase KdpD [Alphaproteobacteria bacterium]